LLSLRERGGVMEGNREERGEKKEEIKRII
jgi:hypothetical protein